LTTCMEVRYNNAMETHETIKRTSVYIPLELADKVQQSAKIHRRSFNQELLWLAENSIATDEQKSAHASEVAHAQKVVSGIASSSLK